MPNKRGPNTYHGYLSPPPGEEIDAHQRHVLKVVYGSCREQHHGEDPENKSYCARVAWAEAERA
jgi:hypothetical protein